MKIKEKHPLWLRILHWTNVPALFLMIWSGILIYWSNDEYTPFFPEWFYDFFGISHRLAEGLAIHFSIGWIFVANGFAYAFAFFKTKRWREVFPGGNFFREIIPVLLHDLGLRSQAPKDALFNAAQRLAYTSALFLALTEILSGFAIYKPVQLAWMLDIFGGYKGARLVHFAAMIGLSAFIFVHIMQVARSGWSNFRAIVAGFEWEKNGE